MAYTMLLQEQEDGWDSCVRQCLNYECYHTWEYYNLDSGGTPILFVFHRNEDLIALPLIKRTIRDTEFYDLTSAYGYSGPIANKRFRDFSPETIEDFSSALIHTVAQLKCVSIFSRLHPFIDQTHLLNRLGGVHSNGKTLYIDLEMSPEEQRKRYDKRLFRQIVQLRKRGYQIRETNLEEDIQEFVEMYTDNMMRVNASPSYFFKYEYFQKLLSNLSDNCKLIMIYDGSVAICGAVIMHNKEIIRNHLSATRNEYLNESPSKLLTDEISVIGRRYGAKFFHLGGGVGGKEDSLYKFKSYFSTQYLDDFTWKFIANEEVYNSLSASIDPEISSGYFPYYRSAVK